MSEKYQQQLAAFNAVIQDQLNQVAAGTTTVQVAYDTIINYENSIIDNPATQAEIDQAEANSDSMANE
jgi:hypothetical protein